MIMEGDDEESGNDGDIEDKKPDEIVKDKLRMDHIVSCRVVAVTLLFCFFMGGLGVVSLMGYIIFTRNQ